MLNKHTTESAILRELLAGYAHDAWTGWMNYLFTKGTMNQDGSFTIHPDSVERWLRQAATEYSKLSHAEKESDRAEADKMIALLRAFIS